MAHERNTADERYESLAALFGDDGPTVRYPYGIAYEGVLTGALTIVKGGLRKLDGEEAVIVDKRNVRFTVTRDGDVIGERREEPEKVGEFEYAFRLGENQ